MSRIPLLRELLLDIQDVLEDACTDIEKSLEHLETNPEDWNPHQLETFLVGTLDGAILARVTNTINAARGVARARTTSRI